MKQVAAALIYHQGKFLIGKRRSDGSNPSVWEFPGGKLEPGESYEDCLIRECREECGLEVEPLECGGVWPSGSGEPVSFKRPSVLIWLAFLCV